MPEKKVFNIHEQQKLKPQIEDVIPVYHAENPHKKAILDFAAYMRANDMPPKWSHSFGWAFRYKYKPICYIELLMYKGNQSWSVSPVLSHMDKYGDLLKDEGLCNIIWDNVCYCTHYRGDGKGCNPNKGCAGGRSFVCLGKEFKGICGCRLGVKIYEPNETTVNGIKRLLELEKKARDEEPQKIK